MKPKHQYNLQYQIRLNLHLNYDLNYGNDITEIKDQIYKINEKFICKATFKQLMEVKITWNNNNEPRLNIVCSLNPKDYKDYKIVCPDGYEIKKLGDVCIPKRGTRVTDDIYVNENKTNKYKYPLYGAGKIQGYTDKFNREGYNCIISRVGSKESKNCCKIIYDKFYISDAAFTIDLIDDNKYNKIYLYNYLLMNYDNIFTNTGSGSVQLTISGETLNNCKIPFPKNIDKHKKQLDELYKIHQQIMSDTEQIPQSEQDICGIIKKAADEGVKGVDYDEYKLGDICDFQDGYDFYRDEMDSNKIYPTNWHLINL